MRKTDWVRRLSGFFFALWSSVLTAQELEPRSYSAVPVGTNFLVATYARSTGDILFDPSLPVTDLHAGINTYSLGYSHSFGLFDHVASIALLAPYANASVTGNVEGAPGHVYRSGAGDLHFRFAVDLLGGPALDPTEFARRRPGTLVGASLSAIAPPVTEPAQGSPRAIRGQPSTEFVRTTNHATKPSSKGTQSA
jgi:hypothetical protein